MEAFGPASTASTAFCWLQQPRRACANLTCFPWSWRKLKHFRCWQVKSSANVCLTLLLSLLISGNLFATAPLRLSRSIRSVPSAKKRSGARWTASVLDAQGVGVSGCTGLCHWAEAMWLCDFWQILTCQGFDPQRRGWWWQGKHPLFQFAGANCCGKPNNKPTIWGDSTIYLWSYMGWFIMRLNALGCHSVFGLWCPPAGFWSRTLTAGWGCDCLVYSLFDWVSKYDADYFTMMQIIIEGRLEVKLPTIWTDEKQRWEESERREE